MVPGRIGTVPAAGSGVTPPASIPPRHLAPSTRRDGVGVGVAFPSQAVSAPLAGVVAAHELPTPPPAPRQRR